jgi:hypothetical protein
MPMSSAPQYGQAVCSARGPVCAKALRKVRQQDSQPLTISQHIGDKQERFRNRSPRPVCLDMDSEQNRLLHWIVNPAPSGIRGSRPWLPTNCMSCPYRLRWLDHCPFKAADRDRRPVGTPDMFQVPKCSWTHTSLSRWKKGIVTPWYRHACPCSSVGRAVLL